MVDSLWLQPQVTVPSMRQAAEQRRIDDSCMTSERRLLPARLPLCRSPLILWVAHSARWWATVLSCATVADIEANPRRQSRLLLCGRFLAVGALL